MEDWTTSEMLTYPLLNNPSFFPSSWFQTLIPLLSFVDIRIGSNGWKLSNEVMSESFPFKIAAWLSSRNRLFWLCCTALEWFPVLLMKDVK
jgi:hypothetical protein